MVKDKKHKGKKQPGRGLGQKEKKFLHLKEFSQGKPNELSLNVLEQKAADLEEPPRRFGFWRLRSKNSSGSAAHSLFSPSAHTSEDSSSSRGSSSISTSSASSRKKKKKTQTDTKRSSSDSSFLGADSQAEIKNRQKRRKRYRYFSIAVVIVLCVAFLGAGGYWFYQEQVKLSTSVGVLHQACDIIAKSDEVTVSVDEYFQTSFNDDTIDTATNLKEQLPSVREDLDSARVYAQKARDELEGSQRDKEAADHVLATIVSRETMLDCADKRLDDDIVAKKAIDLVTQAQGCINEGNALLAQSAQVISHTTEDTVAQSTEYTTSAKAQFEEAKSYLQQAQECYQDADFTDLQEYINLKSEAAGQALASNAAILIQDKKTAESYNDEYNKIDAQATALAKNLPSDLTQLVVEVYAENQDPLIQDYEKARSDAATHDAFLRDYLGTNS